jgi:hypothetical protein
MEDISWINLMRHKAYLDIIKNSVPSAKKTTRLHDNDQLVHVV